MSRTLSYAIPLAFAAAVLAGPVSAEPTIQLLADSCAVCHGTDGNSPEPIDALDDIERAELLEERRELKHEQGKGRIMRLNDACAAQRRVQRPKRSIREL